MTIYDDGDQSRDFTFVDNVVGANLLAADAPGVGGEILNVATGESVTVNALADAIGAMLDKAVEKAYEPARRRMFERPGRTSARRDACSVTRHGWTSQRAYAGPPTT